MTLITMESTTSSFSDARIPPLKFAHVSFHAITDVASAMTWNYYCKDIWPLFFFCFHPSGFFLFQCSDLFPPQARHLTALWKASFYKLAHFYWHFSAMSCLRLHFTATHTRQRTSIQISLPFDSSRSFLEHFNFSALREKHFILRVFPEFGRSYWRAVFSSPYCCYNTSALSKTTCHAFPSLLTYHFEPRHLP